MRVVFFKSLAITLAFNCQRSARTEVRKTFAFAAPPARPHRMVEMIGIEPTASGLQSPRSPN